MKPLNKRDWHLSRRFHDAKEWKGFVLERRIREERKMLKKTRAKLGRKFDRQAIQDSLELLDI